MELIDKIKWPVAVVLIAMFAAVAVNAYASNAYRDDSTKLILEKCEVVTLEERQQCVDMLERDADTALESRILNHCSGKSNSTTCARDMVDAFNRGE